MENCGSCLKWRPIVPHVRGRCTSGYFFAELAGDAPYSELVGKTLETDAECGCRFHEPRTTEDSTDAR